MTALLPLAADESLSLKTPSKLHQTLDDFLRRVLDQANGVAKACLRVLDAAKASKDVARHSAALYERYLVTTSVIAFSEGISDDVLKQIRVEMLAALLHEKLGPQIVEAIMAEILQANESEKKLKPPANSHAHTAVPAAT